MSAEDIGSTDTLRFKPALRLRADAETPTGGKDRNSDSGRSYNTGHFAARVRTFANLLSPDQLARVRSRRRFHSMPHLRRADSPNPDDLLP